MSDERIAKESEISLHISCKLQNQRKHNRNFSFFRLDGKILVTMNIIAEPQNITEVFKSSDLLTTRARGRSLLTQEICLLYMTCINAERGLKTTTTTTTKRGR